MDVPEHRRWMYNRTRPRVGLLSEFVNGVEGFINYVFSQRQFTRDGMLIRCPCVRCGCLKFLNVDTMKLHLFRKGFMANYHYWMCHGEESPTIQLEVQPITHQNDMQQNYIKNLDQY